MMAPVRRAVNAVEDAFDRIKLSYKWRFGRWDELQIAPYRGYGNRDRLFLKGRVLDDKGADLDEHHDSLWKSIANTIRRIETDEIPGALVRVHVPGAEVEVETDEDGFFDVVVDLESPLAGEGPWHTFPVELLRPTSADGSPVRADAHVVVPPEECEYAVVSDLDDTVIRTGATNRWRMIRTVVLNTAHTRSPFPGVAGFYRALTQGPDGRGHNPTFYVSSSPWNFYGMFETFMEVRGIPFGPIFLKDFGFTDEQFFSAGHEQHKLAHIRRLMEIYPDLPFVLVGDTGQKDPEIYAAVAREHPHRILVIYLRDVTTEERDREVDRIADELAAIGVPVVRTEHTTEAAEHAADHGLIAREAIDAVRADEDEEERRSARGRLRTGLVLGADPAGSHRDRWPFRRT